MSRRVLVTVLLKELDIEPILLELAKLLLFHLPENIPRENTIFREEFKTKYIHSNLTYRIELPIDHSLFLKVVPFDRYKRHDYSRKVEKQSIGCLIYPTTQKKDSTRDLCIVLQLSSD